MKLFCFLSILSFSLRAQIYQIKLISKDFTVDYSSQKIRYQANGVDLESKINKCNSAHFNYFIKPTLEELETLPLIPDKNKSNTYIIKNKN